MKERTVPSGFKDLAEHDEMVGKHLEWVWKDARRAMNPHTRGLSQCCGAYSIGEWNLYNIQHSSMPLTKAQQDVKALSNEFTIQDKQNGPVQLLWRDV